VRSVARKSPAFAASLVDHGAYPREALAEAIARVVAQDLAAVPR